MEDRTFEAILRKKAAIQHQKINKLKRLVRSYVELLDELHSCIDGYFDHQDLRDRIESLRKSAKKEKCLE